MWQENVVGNQDILLKFLPSKFRLFHYSLRVVNYDVPITIQVFAIARSGCKFDSQNGLSLCENLASHIISGVCGGLLRLYKNVSLRSGACECCLYDIVYILDGI